MTMTAITADQAHVLLDAIAIAYQQAPATNYSPWKDYTPDLFGYDDKATEAGWYDLLGEAKAVLTQIVGNA
jgi:hypothetical protein